MPKKSQKIIENNNAIDADNEECKLEQFCPKTHSYNTVRAPSE